MDEGLAVKEAQDLYDVSVVVKMGSKSNQIAAM